MSRTFILVLLAIVCLVAFISSVHADSDSNESFNQFRSCEHGDRNGKCDTTFISCEDDSNMPFTSFVNIRARPEPDMPADSGRMFAGRLRVPKVNGVVPAAGTVPAVVLIHGSSGLDSRGEFHSTALNEAGIATLEIDLWAARGWYGGVTGRPRGVPETLPEAYGALYFLSEIAAINKSSIGLMGFSWGGVAAMLTSQTGYTDRYSTPGPNQLKFAGHVAHYPVCWAYNQVPGYSIGSYTGSPVLIQTGDLDDYDTPSTCSTLISSLTQQGQDLIDLNLYGKSTHAFDRLQPTMVVSDPYSHLGRGGNVTVIANRKTAAKARDAALGFFRKQFGMKRDE